MVKWGSMVHSTSGLLPKTNEAKVLDPSISSYLQASVDVKAGSYGLPSFGPEAVET